MAFDRFGNAFVPGGIGVGWHVVPEELGTIDSRTGRFTAGDKPVEGYVVAVAARSLRFGDSGVGVNGSAKILVGQATTPEEMALLPNWPNPFNAETRISFSLPRASSTVLEIYNLLGQRMEVLLDRELPRGAHSVVWHANGVPTGTYLYRLTTDARIWTRKMMLTR